MGLLAKLTGTKHPVDGVVPASAEELRATLLGLDRADAPLVIRNGAAEGADLVVEWRIAEPAWQNFFVQSRLTHAIRIRMRLVEKDREVRALEEQWEVTRVGNPPRFATGAQYSRGQGRTVSRSWTIQRGDSGRLEATEAFRFDSARLRDPLRAAVLQAGWTWRGLVFGKL